MDNNEEVLTDEEKLAAEKKETEELSDADFEALVEKRLGAKPADLIKKTEQIKVLTPEEKAELEEKENNEALKTGLELGWVSKKEYDSYLEATKSPKVDIARKKFIEQNNQLSPEEAGKKFDKLIRLDEDDELEDKEVMVPNDEKLTAKAWAEKIAEEELDKKFGKIKNLPNQFKAHQEEQALVKANTELITKAISGLPKKLEIKSGDNVYMVDVTNEDKEDTIKEVLAGAAKEKGLTVETIKANAFLHLKVTNLEKIIAKVEEDTEDRVARGKKGVMPERKEDPAAANEKMEFAKRYNLIPK